MEYLLDLFPVVAVDLGVARVHAELWATLQSRGEMIGTHDLLIAATARCLDYSIVTLNVHEFQRVPGITVYNPQGS